MNTFLSREELGKLGLKTYGEDVLIGKHAVLYHPEKLSIGSHVRIDDFTIISGNVMLGSYIHIAQYCGLYGGESGIIMEDYSGLSSKCSVYAQSDDYSGDSMTNPMIPEKYKPRAIDKGVKLEKHVIIGSGSVVLPGVIIGEGTAVGSMTLCNKSLEPWSIYAGIPARVRGERKKEILNLERQLLAESRNKFFVGQELSEEKVFNKNEVEAFADISGDNNPLHMDERYAEKSRFGGTIVHGILIMGLISKIIGTQLPGEGSIYLGQNARFIKPVYIGEKIKANVKIIEINEEKKILILETNIYKEDGNCAVEGEAKVLFEG